MPRGSSDDGNTTMVYKSKDIGGRGSSSHRGKSYISSRPTKDKAREKDDRKASISDSLAKFLDDCGDEDLLMATATRSPSAKSRVALSMSEHGPRSPGTPGVFSPAKPIRRGTKNGQKKQRARSSVDDEFDAITKFHNSLNSGMMSPNLSMSEHGTPGTNSKASVALHSSAKPMPILDKAADDASSGGDSFADASLAGEEGSSRRKTKSKKKSKSSSSSTSSPSSKSSKTTRKKSHRSDKTTNSPRERRLQRTKSTSSRVDRSFSDRSGNTSSRSVGRAPRRTKSDGPMSLNQHFGSSRRGSMGPGSRRMLDDEQSVGSTRSTISNRSRSLGLDAGPLNAFLNAGPHQRRPSLSSQSVGPGLPLSGPASEAFISTRRSRQDEILKQALQDQSNASRRNSADTEELSSELMEQIPDGDDDDQPKVKGKKKSAFARLKDGITKTGKMTKSTAKGTVNVVRDPKRAVKKVGGFAKDVGKGTVQMALDPKLAAKTAANLGKDITKGTYKVTKGVGKGVAKGSLGVTKAVAKTGVNATTMVVGTALDGAGHLVNGATGLIFKNGLRVDEEDHEAYNAAELKSRRVDNVSLLQRINNVYDGGSGTKDTSTPPRTSQTPRGNGIMVPTLATNQKSQGWDF